MHITEHIEERFLGLGFEVIASNGIIERRINYSKRWRPGNRTMRDRELAKWNKPQPGDLIFEGTLRRVAAD